MGYAQYLKDVLKPLHIYDLDLGAGADEITVLGEALDGIYAELEVQLREMIPLTAQSFGLENYESILPCTGIGSIADRQSAIAAMTSETGFGIDALRRSLRGCGIEVALNEYGTETVIVSFDGKNMSSAEIAQLKRLIEEIIPCHLAIVYETAYSTWRELEHENFTWNRIEYEELTWHTIQTYDVEVEE